jgi:hypothetical protein
MIFSFNDENNLTATIPISMDNQLGIMMRTSTEFYVEKRPVNIIITTNKFSYWKNELVNVTVQVRDVFGLAVKNMQTHLKIYNPKTSYQYYVVDYTNDNGYVSFIWNATSIGKIEISVKSIETSIYYNGSSAKITTVYYGFVSSLANITSHSNYVNDVTKGQQVSVTFQVFGIKNSDNSKVALANYKVNATLIRYEIIKEVKAFNTSQSNQQTGQSARIYDERPSGLGIGRFELPRGLPEPRLPIIIMNSGSSSSSSSLQNITTWLGIEQIIDRVTLTTDSSGYASYTFTVGDDPSKDYLYYVVLDVLDDYYNYNNDTYYVPSSSNAVAFKTVTKVLRFEIELYKYVDGKWTYTKSYTGSGIYKLKATVRDFVTFEKLSVNNIHFGFNQSNSYYLMGKNSSVNGDVMFKFDASKYDIKDGNVTFWIWSPDIPSLGSIPKPINLTQSSSQGNTGNVPKLGYAVSSGEANLYKSNYSIFKLPRIELKVTRSEVFQVAIVAKLFDSNNNTVPGRNLLLKIRIFAGSVEWVQPDNKKGVVYITASKNPIFEYDKYDLFTDSNGEVKVWLILSSIPPYIKFANLYVWVSLNEYWNSYWPNSIYSSLLIPVGKWVTIHTDVNVILKNLKQFYNTTEEVKKVRDFNVTTYKYTGEISKTKFYIRTGTFKETEEKYIGFYFKMELGPDNKFKDIYQAWNYITDLNGSYNINSANFYKHYNKRLENELKFIERYDDLMELASKNAYSRFMYKVVLQLKFHSWFNLGNLRKVMETYKDDILNVKDFALLPKCTYFIYFPYTLQERLDRILRRIHSEAATSSPAYLYSLALSTGDYRYILVAIKGSIEAIKVSLGIGLPETKTQTKELIEKSSDASTWLYAIISGIASRAGPPGWVIAIITGIYAAVILPWEKGYLIDNTYSPQYLRNLVKITEYDLTLLNYEVNLWDQLQD